MKEESQVAAQKQRFKLVTDKKFYKRVLSIMRKPPFSQFGEFKKIFDRINREEIGRAHV